MYFSWRLAKSFVFLIHQPQTKWNNSTRCNIIYNRQGNSIRHPNPYPLRLFPPKPKHTKQSEKISEVVLWHIVLFADEQHCGVHGSVFFHRKSWVRVGVGGAPSIPVQFISRPLPKNSRNHNNGMAIFSPGAGGCWWTSGSQPNVNINVQLRQIILVHRRGVWPWALLWYLHHY